MREFIVLAYSNINGLNGSAGFVRIFKENESLLKEQNINLNIYSNSSSFSDESKYRHSISFRLKSIVNAIIQSTDAGKIKRFYYDVNVLGDKPVEKLKERELKDSFILLNDIFVASNFYKKFGNKYKTAFMMHNDGDMLSMLKVKKIKKIQNELLRIEESIIVNATYLIFVSKRSKENFMNKYPEIKNKCKVINIGIKDSDIFNLNRDYTHLNLVSIGTICKRKNQIAIIRAIKEIGDSTIKLTLVGGRGDGFDECEKYVKNYNMDDQVTFTGAQQNISSFLEAANCFIMTSFDEGLPISAQEAMSYKLPLIMTDVGGCQELICGNGLLIEVANDTIKQAISDLNQRLDELEDMGERSYLLYKKQYTVEKMIGNYIDFILNE